MPDVRVRSARGGHGRALEKLALYQQIYQRGVLRGVAAPAMPDLLVVAIDANCSKLQDAQRTVIDRIRDEFKGRTVIATPDPPIERWYIADPESFVAVVGVQSQIERRKCERGRYKQILADAVAKAGHVSTLGGN